MDSAEDDLGFAEILRHLSARCHTSRGAERASKLELAATLEEAQQRLSAVREVRWLSSEKDVHLSFAGVTDISAMVKRCAKGGTLQDPELIDVARAAEAFARLARAISDFANELPALSQLAADLSDCPDVYRTILPAYGDDARLADHASPELGGLRRVARQVASQLERKISTMVEDNADYLQDAYFTQREGRYVIPVRASNQSRVGGIVHGTSQSGQTVFVEPAAVVDLGNKLRLAECAVEDEENRIRAVFSRQVAAAAPQLSASLEISVELDCRCAAGELADATDSSEPVLGPPGSGLELRQARHPLIVLASKPCIANDIMVAEQSVLIVSGPNAGGKTVALKTVGLTALMARAGLHVLCAEGSEVPWFEDIFTDIGDAQSLSDDLSTFSGHIAKLRHILRSASMSSLVLIDEISVGTEPEQGAALAQAVLESMANRRLMAVVTTHYDRLKLLGAEHERFANASVGFNLDEMRPTFELHLGVPGSSGALAVATRQGMPEAVIERAQSLIGQERASFETLLAEVSSERKRLATELADVETVKSEAEMAVARAELAREKARETERRLREDAHVGAVAALRDARAELERARESLRKTRSRGAVDAADKAIDRAARKVSQSAPARPEPTGIVPAQSELVIGARVYVASLDAEGHVATKVERGKVTVRVGAIKTQVSVGDLRLPGKKSGKKTKKKASSGFQTTLATPDAGRNDAATLDLRGSRVDDAIDAVDRFIDRALLDDRDEIWLIHGHGTGALRKAVRTHIAAHRLIAKTRPGERREGGDGVTVAYLAQA